MCNDTLVQAIQRYLDAEICSEGLPAGRVEGSGESAEVRHRLLEARRHLQDELYLYAEARSRQITFQRILVAVNDGAPARWAIEVAARLAEELNASLALVHVVEPPHPIPTEVGWVDIGDRTLPRREGEDLLRKARWRIPSTVSVERFLREGDAAHEITEVARRWGADLIVIGTHGRGRFSNLLFGSTANSVARLVSCPVMTVAHQPLPSRRVKAFLDSRRIGYRVIDHAPEFTAMETAAAAHVPGKDLAKTIIVKLDGELAMVVLPATHRLDLELLRIIADARRVELAEEEEFVGLFPDCELGAMPPFGNLYNMKVYAAEALTRDEEIAFPAGTHAELIQMKYEDFESLVRPMVISVSEPIAASA